MTHSTPASTDAPEEQDWSGMTTRPIDFDLHVPATTDALALSIDDRTIRARKFASQIMPIIQDCVSDKDGAMSRLIDAAYQTDVEIVRKSAPQETRGDEPVAWQILDKHGRWITLPGDWNESENIEGRQYRPLYAAPQESPRLEREEIKDAIRTFCQSLGAASVQMSHGVERIYYSGISLDALSAAVVLALSPIPSTSRCGASDAPEEVTGAEMDAIEAAAIAGNPLTTNDYELAGWARQWHWNDCAGDQPVDPSIYFRDMRMLKAFIQKCQSVTSKDRGAE